MDERQEALKGMQRLIEFLAEHPELPLPDMDFRVYTLDSKEQARMVAKKFGSFEKDANEWYFSITKPFARGEYGRLVALTYVFNRGNVCTKRVIGVETVPAKFVEAHVIEAHTKEIVEWDCEPLLGEANASNKND